MNDLRWRPVLTLLVVVLVAGAVIGVIVRVDDDIVDQGLNWVHRLIAILFALLALLAAANGVRTSTEAMFPSLWFAAVCALAAATIWDMGGSWGAPIGLALVILPALLPHRSPPPPAPPSTSV